MLGLFNSEGARLTNGNYAAGDSTGLNRSLNNPGNQASRSGFSIADYRHMLAAVLCPSLAAILRSEDEGAIRDACLVIRDAALLALNHPNRGAFLAGLREWRVIDRLEDSLFLANHFVRGVAVYTLGKIDASESVPALRRAFALYRDTDPLLVPEVITECAWLGADRWDPIDSAIDSPVYATRWGIVQYLAQHAGGPSSKAKQIERLRRLVHDESPS